MDHSLSTDVENKEKRVKVRLYNFFGRRGGQMADPPTAGMGMGQAGWSAPGLDWLTTFQARLGGHRPWAGWLALEPGWLALEPGWLACSQPQDG